MKKIVINKCFGGFDLSEEAIELFKKKAGLDRREKVWVYDLRRDDPALVETVQELGSKADGDCAKLKIVEIPDDVKWMIEEYDGQEWVAEIHRIWG